MPWLDARIPVQTLPDMAALAAALAAGPPAAVLVAAPSPDIPAGAVAVTGFEAAGPPHLPGCACCAGRAPAATALDRLFQARIRGGCGWFERVLVLAGTEADRHAVATALAGDAVTAARFRPA